MGLGLVVLVALVLGLLVLAVLSLRGLVLAVVTAAQTTQTYRVLT